MPQTCAIGWAMALSIDSHRQGDQNVTDVLDERMQAEKGHVHPRKNDDGSRGSGSHCRDRFFSEVANHK